MSTQEQDRVGTVVGGKYRLERLLGTGGFGAVYGAHHLQLDRRVAIKILHPHMMSSPDVVSRFVREARAASKLEHPNVVDVRDIEVDGDGCFMVLEFLEGVSLGDHLESKGHLSLSETLEIVGPVLDALGAAHDHGIVHRDVKPDNVFLSRTRDGRMVPKLLDFGIAKLTEGNESQATKTGAMLGTPYFMSPEQAQGRQSEIGAWTDVWAAAVMVYHCLSEHYPIEIESPVAHAILVALVVGDIVPLSARVPNVPPELSRVLEEALARDPGARTASARTLRTQLEHVLETQGDYVAPSARQVVPAGLDVFGETAAGDAPDAPAPARAIESMDERPVAGTSRRVWVMGAALLAVGAVLGVVLPGLSAGDEPVNDVQTVGDVSPPRDGTTAVAPTPPAVEATPVAEPSTQAATVAAPRPTPMASVMEPRSRIRNHSVAMTLGMQNDVAETTMTDPSPMVSMATAAMTEASTAARASTGTPEARTAMTAASADETTTPMTTTTTTTTTTTPMETPTEMGRHHRAGEISLDDL